ncbi:DUF3905 domain-containing protein [Peribacillus glennii]|uniref:DUF3905 domain-containing protein n=1 Tax=Peribacillus glennii TaxID=2303991 RepID=A0A372LD75_9BACI|nr:DUF3905 domain-containing protein [Peribacillus glennii]
MMSGEEWVHPTNDTGGTLLRAGSF